MALTFKGPVPVPAAQTSPLNVFITGAARGLGFAFVQQYAEAHPGNIVLAGIRKPSPELTAFVAAHSNVHVVHIDVDSEDSVKASVHETEKHVKRLDVLINNAAVSPQEAVNPLTTTAKVFNSVINTNVTGTLTTTLAYLPLLKAASGAKVVNVGSILGSNQYVNEFGSPLISYGVSKAAINYLTMCFRYAVPEVTFLSVHPGWCATDMGSVVGAPPTRPQDSVQAVRFYIQQKTIKNTGEFIDCMTGELLPF